jgi:hypothetical protein
VIRSADDWFLGENTEHVIIKSGSKLSLPARAFPFIVKKRIVFINCRVR